MFYGDVFTEIGCFKSKFYSRLKMMCEPYQVLPRHVAYALQEPFRKELEGLQVHTDIGITRATRHIRMVQ